MSIRGLPVLLLLVLGIAPAMAAAPALSIYGNLPGLEMAALSRSGESVAIVGIVNGERRLVVIDAAAAPRASAKLGDVKVRGLFWAGEDTVLVYKSDTARLSAMDFTTDKAELYSMLVVPLDGKPAWSVFAGNSLIAGGVTGFYGIREKQGKYYGYFGGITYDRDMDSGRYLGSTDPVLYEVDLASQKARRIAPRYEGDGHRQWIVGPDGEVYATLDFQNNKGDWSIRNGDGKRIASGTRPVGGVSLVGIGTAPDKLVYALEDDDGATHWIELPAAGGDGTPRLESVGIRDTVFDERSQQLVGYMEDGDLPVYKFFDAYRQKVINGTLKAFPGKSVQLQGWNESFNKLIVTTEGSGDPQTWWLVDIKTGKATELGRSYTLRAQDIGPVRMVRYQAGDGLDISAVLTLPPGGADSNLPVVVMPHGGPGARDYPGFDWWAQAFASRGYAVLQPNFRGSTGYGAEFQRAGDGEWGRKMQSDLSDGLSFLVQQGIADPRRACIVGASYGGYAALAGVTLQKGIYRCAVSVAGVSDPAEMVVTDARESGSNATLIRVLRKEVGSGKDLRAVSPLRSAAAADAPILLVHGKDDIVVKYAQSANMAGKLRDAGKPFEFLTLPGEDHWLSKGETRLAMLEAVIAFVQKHNPADPGR
jgi:dipeptidyl aminopeptidase/acylaminoacyl peptidase